MPIYKLEEISESRVLYDKNPPKLMIYIIIIVLALLIGFGYWSIKSVKTYMVKGQGLVTSESKFNIMSKVSGEIDEVSIEEGKTVNEGDVLATLKPVESNIQTEQVDSQIAVINKRIDLLKRAEKDAGNGCNGFSKEDVEEREFYNKLDSIYTKEKEFEVDVKALKEKAIKEKSLKVMPLAPEKTKEEKEKEEKEIDEQINKYVESQKLKAKAIRYEGILQFTNEKEQLNFEISKLEAQKISLDKSKEEYKIVAQSNGKVHLNMPVTKGMVLQVGTPIGTIANGEKELIIETLMPSIERPRIHINDEVSMAIGGLNQAEYGTIKGKVLSIDEDATMDKEKGNVFFKVKVQPEQTYLTDKKGEKVNLTLGMVAETRVKYEKITYMKYFLEQIGVKFD